MNTRKPFALIFLAVAAIASHIDTGQCMSLSEHSAKNPTFNSIKFGGDNTTLTSASPVVHSTVCIVSCCFVSTDSASGVTIPQSTVTYTVPYDCKMIGERITSMVSGSVGVGLSSSTAPNGTLFIISTGAVLSTANMYSNDNLGYFGGNKNLARGSVLMIYVTNKPTPATTQIVTYELWGWVRQ